MTEERINKLEKTLQYTFDLLSELREQVGYEIGGGEINPYGFKRLRKCTLADIPAGDIFEAEGSLCFADEYGHYYIVGIGEYCSFNEHADIWQLVQPTVLDKE